MADLSILLQIHIGAALLAIVTGAIVFLLPKGDLRHRRWACAYVLAMLVTTSVVVFVPATVLEFGSSGWGFFHLFIVVGGISSLIGIFALWKWNLTRDPAWLRNHQMRFAFSYAGLLMAGFSQLATNPRFGVVGVLSPAAFWTIFIATNLAILGIAMFLVGKYLAKGDPRRRYALRP
ncbi:hypothetical protein GRI34_02195 [Erythrobacter aquimaris]|uniref:DUF2306 domain-containing protein n=1 Tax=Qipengyuania aquimaris TaxID=255984 RepID=A0A6I4TKX8_9SPHN|nr:hypothetical protein [Qipengyuania aquimaris]MXO95228.1 hypothetical protein [Qipengyuania aquimaris]